MSTPLNRDDFERQLGYLVAAQHYLVEQGKPDEALAVQAAVERFVQDYVRFRDGPPCHAGAAARNARSGAGKTLTVGQTGEFCRRKCYANY